MANQKYIVDAITKEETWVDFTAEEIAERETKSAEAQAEHEAMAQAIQDKKDLKASAKAKLIAGEALTEEEADTIVL